MCRRVANFFKKVWGLWRVILVVSALITITFVGIFTSFQTFMFVLGSFLIVVPVILLFTSGICSDMKFFIKRFEHMPEDDRPTVPGGGIGMSRIGPANIATLEMIKAHEKASRLKGSDKEMYFLKMRGSITGIDYDSLKIRARNKGELSEETISDLSTDEKLLDVLFHEECQKIEETINEINGRNIKKIFHQDSISYQFDFHEKSDFSFLLAVIIEHFIDGTTKIETIIRKFQPFSLALMKFETEEEERIELSIPELAKIYLIDYSHPKILEKILEEENIIEALYSIHPFIDSFKIDRKYFLTEITDTEKVLDVLNTLRIVNKRLISEEAGLIEVEEIKCYKCNYSLEISDKKCPKCGEKRPECGVCLLDLYPSEAKEIVRTSCCGIYAHKDHLIMWLDKTDTCPNCRTRKPNWTRFLE
ncbi:MAG: hypothetical protein H7641_00255 [Candidatus Heimdallarchaeota archaeon]|nr:hypothetical protein [Candidatus Heimdallarchaeota archaeon]MCK4875995.1 hypothetical protein [Candidatus Heimdallarchaeota archaeon]